MNKNSDIVSKISQEKNKAVHYCANLENKKEQMALLVKQLQNLALTRDSNFINSKKNDILEDFTYITPPNLVINRELSIALKDQERLDRDIKSLKNKIKILNNKLNKY